MNLLLIDDRDFISEDEVVVEGRRANHLRHVLRAAPGTTIRTGRLNGLIGTGTILRLNDASAHLRVSLTTAPPAAVNVHLVLALPRPKVLGRVLAASASIGVKRISLINAWKVDKAYWKSPALEPSAIEEELRLGLEQAVDTTLPQVVTHRFLRRWAEGNLRDEVSAGTTALVAHPGGETELRQKYNDRPCMLIVGPEGGFLDREIELLARCGASVVHAGERILRVETAIPWLLSRLV